MRLSLKKAFRFSCSYTIGARVLGRNYVLWISTENLSASEESRFAKTVEECLISKLHNHDLSQNVDFLKDTPIDDALLIEASYKLLSKEVPDIRIHALELECDASTRVTYAS